MKLAIGYSTKDQLDLTRQSWERLVHSLPKYDPIIEILWADASTTAEAVEYWDAQSSALDIAECVTGGADAAIAWKLTKALETDATHIMLLENDVLLDEDWYEPTINLFREGLRDGLDVGAVSPRSYVDRVLIQRDGYAVMHNLGAGVVVFTREAAEIVLRTFRTHWWPSNVSLFAQVSGIDLRTYAAFRGMEDWVTTDWGWEAQLARHGLASLALTPAKASMIGQVPSLHEQGLELVQWADACRNGQLPNANNDPAFIQYRNTLAYLRRRDYKFELPDMIHRDGAGMLFFAHQLGALSATWQGTLELQNSQGYGPFAYRAGPGGASLSVRISGSACFQCSGGAGGAQVTIEDHRSGFKASPSLPPGNEPISIAVPGTVIPRQVTMQLAEGAVFFALVCNEPQMIDTTWKFDWSQLPRAE